LIRGVVRSNFDTREFNTSAFYGFFGYNSAPSRN